MNTSPYLIELNKSFDQFLSLESEWNELLGTLPDHTVFQTHPWMRTWWETARTTEQILLVTARSEGKLIGIAPMMMAERKVRHLLVNDIRFISTLKPARSPLSFSGMQDFLISPGYEHILPLMLDKLIAEITNWTNLFLQPVPENSQYYNALVRFIDKHNFRSHQRIIIENALQKLDGTFESYLASLSKNMRKNINRALRNFQQNENASIKFLSAPEQMEIAYEHILQIEEHSWKWEKGVRINGSAYHDFYTKLMREFAARRWIRIYILYYGEQPVAYDLNVVYNRSVKTLKGSYNRDFAQSSPGAVLTYFEIKDFYKRRLSSFDLLWGDLDYKQKWTSELVPHLRIEIVNNTPAARLASWLEHSKLALNVQHKWDKRGK